MHRRKVIELIGEANAAGAGLLRACGVIGICLRTLKRWRKAFLGDGDGVDRRKGSARLVGHRLSEEERQRILLTCNQPEYAALPPGQIVPALADQKLFIGSESSFYRVLHMAWSMPPPRPGQAASGTTLGAAPQGGSPQCPLVVGHQLSADHSAGFVAVPLPGGRHLEPPTWPWPECRRHLVVAWDVAEVESAQNSADLVQRAYLKERYRRTSGFESS